jgi:glycosyltransferase involved in cell wall biosynthesis
MKIDHNFTAPVTMVVTSCNRFDLLEQTLDTFFFFNTYPHIAQVIVVDDSGIPGSSDRLKEKYAETVTWLHNETRLGQIAAIDRAYALVKTPYIFHCEEDWEFYEQGFIEASIAILEANREVIVVWLRAHDDTNGHPLNENVRGVAKTSCGDEVKYRIMAVDYDGCWHGFSFNPGVRRLEDYTNHFPEGFSQCVGFDRSNPNAAEAKIGHIYKMLGYYAAILDVSTGFVRHTGWTRHVF